MRTETNTEELRTSKGSVQEKRPSKLPIATMEEIKAALAKGRLVDQDMIPVLQSQNGRRNGH